MVLSRCVVSHSCGQQVSDNTYLCSRQGACSLVHSKTTADMGKMARNWQLLYHAAPPSQLLSMNCADSLTYSLSRGPCAVEPRVAFVRPHPISAVPRPWTHPLPRLLRASKRASGRTFARNRACGPVRERERERREEERREEKRREEKRREEKRREEKRREEKRRERERGEGGRGVFVGCLWL